MDEDFENESQSAVSSIAQLLSLWMTRSLWHARLSVPDTFLLEESHIVRWYYTSASSGKVLKHSSKRLDWKDLLKFFARAGRANCSGKQKDSSSKPGVIAVARRLKRGHTYPVLLTAADLKSLREKHTAHLLNEIVMIQSYITKQPFAGCGVFETDFQRTGQQSTDIPALATFELARWPEDNVTWFEDIETLASDSSQHHTEEFLYRNGDGSSKRVHGVVHRTLAATTKAIVEHVQEKTGKVILRVLAQYAFRPGSGQPTLLWLDSVTTQGSSTPSVQSLSQRIAIDEKGIEDESCGQLREETNDRSWTTFFPPKLSDLVSGGSVKVAGCSARQNGSSFTEKSSKLHIPRTFLEASKAIHASVYGSQTQANRLEHRPMNADSVTEDDHRSGLEGDSIPFEMDALRRRPNGQHRQTFTLPTESWAIRSSGWRGLYFSGVRGSTRGGKRVAMSERWPRKRSTGTTMRIDDRRPDLRSAFSSDGRWPWTGLPSQPSKRGPRDGVNRRIANKANGCFGDFCDGSNRATGEERKTPNESCKSPAATATAIAGGSLLMASNVVPYVSILKCRAEERAISLRHHQRIWPPPEVYQEARTTDIKATPCWIAERMGALGINLNDRGRSEFYRLSSSDRGKAGAPEATRRAVEELLYEEELTHLHPTTIFRPVPVCDSCAMVYDCMDGHRKKTKQLKAVAGHDERVARMAHRHQAKAKPTTRRYSDLNLNDSATARE